MAHPHPMKPNPTRKAPAPAKAQRITLPPEELVSKEAIAAMRKAILDNKIPMIGTIFLQPTGCDHKFPIPNEWAQQMIADQYGDKHEFIVTFPHCNGATLSVRAGMLSFLEARIVAPAVPPPSREAELSEALEAANKDCKDMLDMIEEYDSMDWGEDGPPFTPCLDELQERLDRRDYLLRTTVAQPASAQATPPGPSDGEMLDWLEKERPWLHNMSGKDDGPYAIAPGGKNTVYGKTFRQAIAAAMSRQTEEGR